MHPRTAPRRDFSLAESLLRAGLGLQDARDEDEAATIIAQAIEQAGWRTVIVSLYDEDLRTVAMGTTGVSSELRERLIAQRGDGSARRRLFSRERDPFLVGRFYFVPEERAGDLGIGDIVIATGRDGDGDRGERDAWRPKDHAYAALRDTSGLVIGRVAIDDPTDGLRPTAAALGEISAFVDLASRTVENLRLRRSLAEANRTAIRSEKRWRAIVENVNVVAWEAAPGSFDFTYVSPHAERVLGYPTEEWLAPGFWLDHLHPDDRDRAAEFCLTQAKLGLDHDFEYRMIARDGSTVWFRDSVTVIRDQHGTIRSICGILIDITDQKAAEHARTDKANRLRVVVGQIPAVLWTLDQDLRFTSSEGRGLEGLGLVPGQVVGMHLSEYLGTGDPEFPPYAAHVRALGGEAANFEFHSPYGTTFECHVEPLYGADGSVAGTIGVALDITRRKAAETQSQTDRERLRKITDAIPVQIAQLDADLKYLFNNATYERWHLKPRDQITGRNARDLLGEEAYDGIAGHIRRALAGEVVQFESRFSGRVSGITDVRTILTPNFDEQGRPHGIFSVTMDISDRVQAERALSGALRHQSNLLRELNHRVKNSMTGLLSLIELSRARERSVDSFAAAIRGRVDGMIRVHSLLSSNEWNPVPLRDLLASLLPTHAPGRMEIDGPVVIIAPSCVGPLGAILQELLSNSLLHGALGSGTGLVRAAWSSVPTETPGFVLLDLQWSEAGGPPIVSAPTPGLGTDLIRGFAEHDLRGRIELGFHPVGVTHRMRVRIGENDHESHWSSSP